MTTSADLFHSPGFPSFLNDAFAATAEPGQDVPLAATYTWTNQSFASDDSLPAESAQPVPAASAVDDVRARAGTAPATAVPERLWPHRPVDREAHSTSTCSACIHTGRRRFRHAVSLA